MELKEAAIDARMAGMGSHACWNGLPCRNGRMPYSHVAAERCTPKDTKGSAVPVGAAGGRGPTGTNGRVAGADAADSRGTIGAKGAVTEGGRMLNRLTIA